MIFVRTYSCPFRQAFNALARGPLAHARWQTVRSRRAALPWVKARRPASAVLAEPSAGLDAAGWRLYFRAAGEQEEKFSWHLVTTFKASKYTRLSSNYLQNSKFCERGVRAEDGSPREPPSPSNPCPRRPAQSWAGGRAITN